MATYRQVHTSFWQDSFVLELTPEEKYFYVYLMTNSKTTQCGIYQLPKKIMELETGYNRETIEKLIQRFVEYGKIIYSETTNEIALVNWPKYNPVKSETTRICVEKELSQVKDISLISCLYPDYALYMPHIGGNDTPSIPHGGNKEEEKEEEKEREEEGEEEPAPAPSSHHHEPVLNELKKIKDWPYDEKKDASLITSIQKDFPGIDILEEAKAMAVWLLDKPFKKNANPRSFFRNWCKRTVSKLSKGGSVNETNRGSPKQSRYGKRVNSGGEY